MSLRLDQPCLEPDRVNGSWAFGALLMSLLVVGLQVLLLASGAQNSDLSGDPDEPAHAVTALMVRDYLTGAMPEHPMEFAKRYYNSFPKVALGHYPPGYYAVAALALLPSPRIATLLFMQAMLLALLGTLTAAWVRPAVGAGLAAVTALLLVLLPSMLKVMVLVMSDLQLAVVCLLAAWSWVRYLDSGEARWSLCFGLLASLAILTKGSGLMLAAVPPLATLLSKPWRALLKPSLWLAALPVVVLAVPWMLYSAPITQEGMMTDRLTTFLPKALSFYGHAIPSSLGWPVLFLIVLALGNAIRKLKEDRRLEGREAVLWAWLFGGLALILLVPAGLSTRYLIPLLPPVILLATGALHAHLKRFRPHVPVVAMLVVVVLTGLQIGMRPIKHLTGHGKAARHLLAIDSLEVREGPVCLISSDARGEGAVIAEACFDLPPTLRLSGHPRFLRVSKELASSDWLGRGYQAAFADPAQVLAHLEKRHADFLLVDNSLPPDKRLPHHDLLEQAIASPASPWKLSQTFLIRRDELPVGNLLLYQKVPGP